jgi:hypothetical protein
MPDVSEDRSDFVFKSQTVKSPLDLDKELQQCFIASRVTCFGVYKSHLETAVKN